MAAGLGAATRDGHCDLVRTNIDAGGGGDLVFLIAADTAAATCPCNATSFATTSGGQMTANTGTSDTNATGNVAAVTKFELRNNAGTKVVSGTVTGNDGTGDLKFTGITGAVVIEAGDTVAPDWASIVYVAPPEAEAANP